MCGRYTLTSRGQEIAEAFELSEPPPWEPRYNIAPGQEVPVVRLLEGRRESRLLRWGFQRGHSGSLVINARAETVAQRPAFRDAFANGRCLVPADGFYEWRRQGAARAPFYIQLAQGGLFAMAGLWHRWPGADGKPRTSTVVLTTRPNALVATIHDRMPLIVSPELYALWLGETVPDADRLAELAAPFPAAGMRKTPVSQRVNRVANDDPALVDPVAPPPDQLGLF